jgi:hypothetical protein
MCDSGGTGLNKTSCFVALLRPSCPSPPLRSYIFADYIGLLHQGAYGKPTVYNLGKRCFHSMTERTVPSCICPLLHLASVPSCILHLSPLASCICPLLHLASSPLASKNRQTQFMAGWFQVLPVLEHGGKKVSIVPQTRKNGFYRKLSGRYLGDFIP